MRNKKVTDIEFCSVRSLGGKLSVKTASGQHSGIASIALRPHLKRK